MRACVSIDLDDYQDYHSLLEPGGSAGAYSFYADALPRFLDLLERHGLRGTFFVIGRDATVSAHRPCIRSIAERGHEVGNHSHSHPYNFRSLTRVEKEAEIDTAGAAIADVVGERPVGFRAPSGDVDAEVLEILAERGYLYDASVVPSPVMWAFMIYGALFVRHPDYQLGQLRSALAPTAPYQPGPRRVYRRRAPGETGSAGVLEIPFSVATPLRIPFYSTLLRRLGPRFFSWLVGRHGRRHEALQGHFHLIELADFDHTPLARAYERAPGLASALDRRQRFLDHSFRELAAAGEPATLRDVALAQPDRNAQLDSKVP